MIGVIASPPDYTIVREFFELFKTPWEFYSPGRCYDVLLCSGSVEIPPDGADLTIIYSGRVLSNEGQSACRAHSAQDPAPMFTYKAAYVPVYGAYVAGDGQGILFSPEHRQRKTGGNRMVIRIGYDLFEEVRILLTVGQPAANAGVPSLDLHIALLRELIVERGIQLIEIPPVPDGYRFLACLTHDVDHPALRQHRFDHTMWGFLYRATAGALFRTLRRRMSVRNLLRSWGMALKLPLVHAGLAKDAWSEFDRDYIAAEKGARSSFFVVPFKNEPGRGNRGPAPGWRATRYGAADVLPQIRTLMSAGCEIGLHGIDAWTDAASGRSELEEIRRVTGIEDVGVRMHWLYFDEHSPTKLEAAGAAYDSTVGYNETVGYRAGTTQVYKPLQTQRLLELPLHVMDTALFFGSHLNLSPEDARQRVRSILENAERLGGCVTVNWHDRSIAPERLWDGFYDHLVEELRSRDAWFATAAEAVRWFRKRRSAVFQRISVESGELRVAMTADADEDVPGLQLRIHDGSGSHRTLAVTGTGGAGTGLKDSFETCFAVS